MRACGPSTGPTACALAGRRCSLWEWQRGVPGGGAFHRCEGRLVSGAVPPPAARPPERAARVPRPVCPGCGRCGRVDPAPAPQRAPLRAGGKGETGETQHQVPARTPPEPAASAAHTQTGHCTRQGSSGAQRHAPTPRLGSLRASPRGSHWRQASSTGPAAPAPRATTH